MDLRKIKTLLQLMNENGLAEMELEEEGIKIKFSKYSSHITSSVETAPMHLALPANLAAAAGGEVGAAEGDEESEGQIIKALMPGTFYVAPSPDQPACVKVGDVIDDESLICIIEAMKVMNEIKAECSGKIVEIFVENGDPVEYGQPLFRIV
jgi:acetyl-CoA carboxylase biotin carboxyl carrier protein